MTSRVRALNAHRVGRARNLVHFATVAAVTAGLLSSGWLMWTPAPARASATSDADKFLADANQQRTAHGVATLTSDGGLVKVAVGWSRQMATSEHLAHNPSAVAQINSQVTPNWRKWGENVGTGPLETSVQAAFVQSPGHYRNMIDPAFTRVGVAVIYAANGALFVMVEFMEPGLSATTATTATMGSRATTATSAPARRPPSTTSLVPSTVAPSPAPPSAPAAAGARAGAGAVSVESPLHTSAMVAASLLPTLTLPAPRPGPGQPWHLALETLAAALLGVVALFAYRVWRREWDPSPW